MSHNITFTSHGRAERDQIVPHQIQSSERESASLEGQTIDSLHSERKEGRKVAIWNLMEVEK